MLSALENLLPKLSHAYSKLHDEGMIDFVECEEVWNADRRNLGVDRRFAQELETFGLVQL